jgi:hypothetical protein
MEPKALSCQKPTMTGLHDKILVGNDWNEKANLLNDASELGYLFLGVFVGVRRIRAKFRRCDLLYVANRHMAPL